MMSLENLNAISGTPWDGALEMVRAFAVQMIGELGGIKGVGMLLVIGFIIGLLACLYEIKVIKR